MQKKKVSSGIDQLDSILGGLYIGDNVLWYEDSGSYSSTFTLNFIKQSLADKKSTVYVTFDRSPKNVVSFLGQLAENQNFTILDCFSNGKGDRSELFNKFYEKDGAQWPYQVVRVTNPGNPDQVAEAIYGLHDNLSGDIRYVIDSLTGMQDLWGGEEQILKFYARTCPKLYELDTIAYWIIEKEAHSSRLKANINKIAQVAIDISQRNGKSSLKIVKAEKRETPYLNDPQTFHCDNREIQFDLQKIVPGRFDIGSRIKVIRKKQGLSQKELAEKTGVTPSSISQIEKNLIYPSLPALFRIADSLSVPLSIFFDTSILQPTSCVFHAQQAVGAPFEKLPKGVLEGSCLFPPEVQDGKVKPYIIKILPGKKLSSHFFNHKGIEIGFLLQGQLRLQSSGKVEEVFAGDVVYLKKDSPELWENPGETPAELFWLKID